jgi:hypothetical protein
MTPSTALNMVLPNGMSTIASDLSCECEPHSTVHAVTLKLEQEGIG